MKFDVKKTIFLVDGSSFLYRAYYGLKPLHTPSGIAVQAVFSFCRMIKKMIDVYGPEYIVLVWDSKGKTTRHEMFPEYKATRQSPPSDLFDQKEYIIRFAEMIGMPQIAQVGIEADDLMFSLAKEWMIDSDNAVVFVTLDKDMGQALTLGQQMYLLDAFKEQFIDAADLQQKMGFPVEKIPFYFALLGDSSDNIPGVKGIGKKTAIDLVNQFDSLEDMYARSDKIKKAGVKTALLANKDNAFLSFQLFLLQYQPMNVTREQLFFNAKLWNNARPLFEELGFKSLTAGAGETKQERTKEIQEKIDYWKAYDFKVVNTQQQLHELCEYLKEKGAFAIDTETTGLEPLEVELIGISVCGDEQSAYYIPCGHKTDELQLPRSEVIAALKPILQNPQYKKYLHNAKYDQLVLTTHGIELAGIALDTLIGANLIIKEWQSASLKKLSHSFFNEEMLTFEDIVKTYKYKDFSFVPVELAALYSCADSYQTFRLVAVIEDAFKKEQKIDDLYRHIEHPLIEVLYEMEKEGVDLDVALLHELDKKVVVDLAKIEADIANVVGKETINLNSPRQMEYLLFSVLQLPPQKKSPTGKYSTDQEVLKALAALHPVPALIIKYRELTKLKNTYIDALPTYVNKNTHRLHTTFSQTAVATGRLASSNPNLQNIPADGTGYGIEVRAAFKAGAGRIFISADYSQIELRVLGYLSQDKNLCDAFLQGHDIHTETSARLFEVALAAVTHEQRQLGKRINFSILYGLTPYGLSKDLGISFKDAKKYIERYFAQYPHVAEWMLSVVEYAKKHGYVETFWGRRRYIPTIYEKNRTMYEEACRIAVNTVAQGTAAEIMKLGMIAVRKELLVHFPESCIVLQIHDELIVSAPEQDAVAVQQLVKQTLESVVQWNIPLEVSTCSGADWKVVTE
ncbi:MAG TPA: DNA polymerase I [Candidatus Babeliales bacterium]|jgi:DNA polymerase-1|nr:DNA polymerase I [Candidatus Babeliales bacterium]